MRVKLIVEVSDDIFITSLNKKSSGLAPQAPPHFSGSTPVEVCRYGRCLAVMLQIRLQGNAAFITLQEGEIRHRLAVALPASADLIKAKKRGHLEKGSENEKFHCCAIFTATLAAATFGLHVSWVLNSPWCFFKFTCLVYVSCFCLLSSLVLMR